MENRDNTEQGFIKIFRSLNKHWIWDDANKLKWWLDILIEVNYTDRTSNIQGKLIDCKRGQCIYSLDTWGKRWRVDKSKVRRFLYLLQSDNMIVLENVHKTTRLTVCNYDSYNERRNDYETDLKRKRNALETHLKPTKEGQEGKEGQERKNIESDRQDFLTNPIWKEQFCMSKGISVSVFESIQKKWIADVDLKGKPVDSYKSYFTNWYNKTEQNKALNQPVRNIPGTNNPFF